MASSDLLSLGCGWTGSFLLPQLEKRGYRYWFTTTGDPPSTRPASTPRALPSPPKNTGPTNLPTFTGPPSKFDPWPYLPAECWDRHSLLRLPDALTNPEWEDRVRALPPARVVLLVFPIRNADVLRQLVHTYESLYPDLHPSWVMLGSTGLWKDGYHTRFSPIDTTNARGQVENVLLSLQSSQRNCIVLNLAGLYGHTRRPINFLRRVAPSIDELEGKGSLHLIHGEDLARAIIVLSDIASGSSKLISQPVWGDRWIVSDTRSYDWWYLARVLPRNETPEEQDKFAEWVNELQSRHAILHLPRPPIKSNTARPSPASPDRYRVLTRVLVSSDFWNTIGLSPVATPVDGQES